MTKETILYFGLIMGMITVVAGVVFGPGVIIGAIIGYALCFVHVAACTKSKVKIKYLPGIEYKYWEVKDDTE